MIGRVTSTKMQKTAVVLIERVAMHPLYKKTFKRSKKYLVDDPIGVKDGDLVEIIKVSPVSKNKHWRVAQVVGKNLAEIAEEKLKAQAEEIIAEVMPEKPEEKEQLSVLGGQLSESSQSVVSKSDKQKTGKPISENRKLKTDNRKTGGKK